MKKNNTTRQRQPKQKPSTTVGRHSPRPLRVGEEIRHALAACLMQGDFPWTLAGKRPSVTVTEVRISPDLRNATAYVMPLGGGDTKAVVKELNAHAHYFKNEIAHEVVLRYVPQLHFSPDESFDYAQKIETILHDPYVARDLKTSDEDRDEE